MNRVRRKKRRGATIVLMAIVMVIFICMAALVIDVGRMFVLRSQIQNAVDAGTLAATLQLRADSKDIDKVATRAREFVQLNSVGVQRLIPEDAILIEVGQWNAETEQFSITHDSPTAVRIRARQDNEHFSFGAFFGLKSFGAPASAIAASDGSPLDIMMVLDLSGSMASNGRIEALRNSAPSFVDTIAKRGDSDRIGVMGLSANPSKYDPVAEGHSGTLYMPPGLNPSDEHHVGVLECNLTNNFTYVANSVLSFDNLKASKHGGWTGTGGSLRDASHYLSVSARKEADRIVVLMSDGHANRPPGNGPGYARSMASYAKSHEVTVYTISLGDSADLTLMHDIADVTGGMHFDATGSGAARLTDALADAFEQVANALKRTRLVE